MSGPLKSYRFAVRCGSVDDPKGKEGLANLTASLMVGGATAHRSYKQILDEFFEMATGFEAQVDKELTVFYGTVHVDHQQRYETLLREMLQEPAFTAEDFERVREDQLNFLRVGLRGTNDEELAKEVLYERLYAGHPYAHHCCGTASGLAAITVEDVRAFHATYFPLLTLEALPAPALPTPKNPQGLEVTLLDKPEARGVAMSFGYPIPVRRGHEDYPALLLAQAWLGQHRNGGRLFDQIREVRGLNYGDYAYIEYFPRGMYEFEPDPNLARQQQTFQVWLRPVVPEKALFAFRLALYEIDQLRTKGMAEEDFERTRNFLSKYVKLLLKTDSLVQGYAIDSAFYGTPEYTSYIAEGLAALTVEKVNTVIRRHLQTRNLHFVAVGPAMQDFAKQLQSSEASPIQYEIEVPPEVLAEDKLVEALPLEVTKLEIYPSTRAFETLL
ncbi:M16 family metallopeptidase [Bryobacter aggregatus]|uniref:M16 family metallopeptidase n=1 Tax=Bryobacter aggregatus TaxID=360054 RepID=UPI00068F56D0|nr:pitrilysin family protein [Bryobacter aggregatus]